MSSINREEILAEIAFLKKANAKNDQERARLESLLAASNSTFASQPLAGPSRQAQVSAPLPPAPPAITSESESDVYGFLRAKLLAVPSTKVVVSPLTQDRAPRASRIGVNSRTRRGESLFCNEDGWCRFEKTGWIDPEGKWIYIIDDKKKTKKLAATKGKGNAKAVVVQDVSMESVGMEENDEESGRDESDSDDEDSGDDSGAGSFATSLAEARKVQRRMRVV
ncbi:hypothetical protein P7C70_g795, partial [Phenoliferia sp. Uapishka_3]